MIAKWIKNVITFWKVKANHIDSGGGKLHWTRCENRQYGKDVSW